MYEGILDLSGIKDSFTFLYEYKLFNEDGNLVCHKISKANSLLHNFAIAFFAAFMWYTGTQFKDVNGSLYYPKSRDCFNFYSARVVFSNNTADATLNFYDYKLNTVITTVTQITGYPQKAYEAGSDYAQLKFIDKYYNAGSDTNIVASALYYNYIVDSSSSNKTVMLAKDVFDPALNFPAGYIIEFSYIFRIQL